MLAADEAAELIVFRFHLQRVSLYCNQPCRVADLKLNVLLQRLSNMHNNPGTAEFLKAWCRRFQVIGAGPQVGEEIVAN